MLTNREKNLDEFELGEEIEEKNLMNSSSSGRKKVI